MPSTRLISLAALAAVLIPTTAPTVRAADPATNEVTVGMVQGMFRDVQPALVKALSRPFRELMRRQSGYSGDITILPDAFDLADAMAAGKCDLGVFHGFEFAWVKKTHPDLVPLVVTVPPGRKVQACVVVHKDAELSSLADLGDECVVLPRGTKSHCLVYLDKLRTGLSPTAALPKSLVTKTAEDVLNGVVLFEHSAVLVDITALAGYKALNPGAFNHLRVLSTSELFPQSVIAYRKGKLDPTAVSKLQDGLATAHKSAAGRPLLMLWSLKGFETVPADYDAQLAGIAEAYPPPVRK